MSSAVAARLWFIWMTAVDGRDHAVTDEEMAASNGVYRTVCTTKVLPAPLVAPPGPRCPRCVAAVRAAYARAEPGRRPAPQAAARHRLRRPGFIGRLRAGGRRPGV